MAAICCTELAFKSASAVRAVCARVPMRMKFRRWFDFGLQIA